MTVLFTLPDLGEGLVDAEIVSWLVDVGDQVASDQPLVEVETAKATVQIPSPATGTVLRSAPGAGAAGGLGYGVLAALGARRVPGADFVLDQLGLDDRLADAGLVVTGEGSLDFQTLGGKGPAGVAAMAKAAGIPVAAVAGRVEDTARPLFDACLSLESFGLPVAESIARAPELVTRVVAEHADLLSRLAAR